MMIRRKTRRGEGMGEQGEAERRRERLVRVEVGIDTLNTRV